MANTPKLGVRVDPGLVEEARRSSPELASLDLATLARVGLVVLATSGAILGPAIAEAVARGI